MVHVSAFDGALHAQRDLAKVVWTHGTSNRSLADECRPDWRTSSVDSSSHASYSVRLAYKRRLRVRAKGQAHGHRFVNDGSYTAVPPACEPQVQAWRSYDADATSGSPESRTTEETGEVAAARGAGARCRGAAALCRAARVLAQADVELARCAISPCTTRSRSIAREHGFPSWNALREEVEARTLSFDAAVEEFVRCATGGATGRAERLLALHPGIATASLHTALVLGDAAAWRRGSRASRARDAAGGPQSGSRCSTRATPACSASSPARAGRTGRDRAAALRARRQSERRVSLELAPGTAAHRALGRALRRRRTCRSPRCCSTRARTRPTACRSTSPAAAATSPRWSCCSATA